jgi:hypothetical protein
VSDLLYSYLHGQNQYSVDFTYYKTPHHPCGAWWAFCGLQETLINGIDEKGTFDLTRNDRWRMTEIQLVGQSRYVLAYVLYWNL